MPNIQEEEKEAAQGRDRKIQLLYARMVSGTKWTEIEKDAGISRQWFDKERKRLHLPSVRKTRKINEEKKKTTEEILHEKKEAQFLTLNEAAAALGITPGVLAVQRRKGKIYAEKEGNRFFFSPNEIKHYRHAHLRLRKKSEQDFLTVKECASLSKKSPATIYNEVKKGNLTADMRGSTILIHKDDFFFWQEQKKQKESLAATNEEIMTAYRRMLAGIDWENTELSQKISRKTFEKRRKEMNILPLSATRRIISKARIGV